MALNTSDASGVQLSAVIRDQFSDIILYEALGAQRFVQFAHERTDLMRTPGEVLKFLKFDDLTGSAALTNESTAIATDGLTASEVSISVAEFGKGVAVSEKLLQVSFVDVLSEQAKVLGRHYGQFGPDLLCRDAALDNANTAADINIIYSTGAVATVTAGDTIVADRAADPFDTLSADIIRKAVEVLQTNNAPKFNNDFYVCIAQPHQLSALRADPDWLAVGDASHVPDRQRFMGEIGRFEDVIFLSSTNLPNGTGAVGSLQFLDVNADTENDLRPGLHASTTPLYQASMFGEGFYALAWALPVELRDNGVEDFGRVHKLAWYAIYGAGILHKTHGVRIETS